MSPDAGDPVAALVLARSGFPREAYEFVIASVGRARKRHGGAGHVTAAQLLDAFRELAIAQFGCLARTVLGSWGVRSTADVGRVVYQLVGAGALGTTDDDDEREFHGVFDFERAFPDAPEDVRLPSAPRTPDSRLIPWDD